MPRVPIGSTAHLEVERDSGFWFARLNRPEKRNALSDELVEALATLCTQVDVDTDARALLFYGAGGHFCAGADFGRFLELTEPGRTASEDAIAAHNRRFGRMLEGLVALPVPTIAVVTGAAMGGGCGLAAACDRVLAAHDATFAMPEVTLGIAPAQIAPFIVARAGATRARWLMLTGTRLGAQAALDAGLVDRVAPAGELGNVVAAELRPLAAAYPAAVRSTKHIVTIARGSPLPASLDTAAREFAGLLGTGAAREGIDAVRGRRPPPWQTEMPRIPEFA